jgi:hypothetical protein
MNFVHFPFTNIIICCTFSELDSTPLDGVGMGVGEFLSPIVENRKKVVSRVRREPERVVDIVGR